MTASDFFVRFQDIGSWHESNRSGCPWEVEHVWDMWEMSAGNGQVWASSLEESLKIKEGDLAQYMEIDIDVDLIIIVSIYL